MKRFLTVAMLLVSMAIAVPAFAASHLNVEVAAIATAIEDRTPVGVGESFPFHTERLYCYTKITGGKTGDYVEHVWRWGDKEMARVPLTVSGPTWRTQSSKRIIRSWTGTWTVDIVNRGQVLKSLSFTIEEPVKKYNGE